MPREPRGEPSSFQMGDHGDGPREPRPVNPVAPVQLVTSDDVEESIASMCRIFGTFVTEGVLGQYREVLEGLPSRAVLDAIKRWLRKPSEDRAARPHELRAMAEAEVGRSPTPVPAVADLEGRRASPDDISAAYAEALRARPDQEFLQWAVAQRARRLAGGESGEGEAEAAVLVARLAGRRPMPMATGGKP
jgi:hypothetical protein